ncbi:MAG: capsule biosynthesis protein [Neisseria sp.]|nr:capsule biosynthesis protein [Neisseria sp.]
MDFIPGNLQVLAATEGHILLLQGPNGPFFRQLGAWLERQGKRVYKINFNFGDEFFYPQAIAHTFAYRGTLEAEDGEGSGFSAFLADFVVRYGICAIVCFGDTRPYHQKARQLAESRDGLSFWVFEEGYFRPSFITLEQHGVNDFSRLPRRADFFLAALPHLAEQEYRSPPAVPGGFLPMAECAVRYYAAANFGRRLYPGYVHHRPLSIPYYMRLWALSGLKRMVYWLADRSFSRRVRKGRFGRFFIVPLQVFNDSQVRVHSDFSSVRNFLIHVMTSFAFHAPGDTRLIVKHHPMDRGFIDYKKVIRHFIRRHPSCRGRIYYVRDTPLPVFLRQGAGMVTLNSTSGISAMLHKMPVITLGRANYDIPGLTYQGSLADFWKKPLPPDADLFHAFRQYHVNITQINGSYYSRVNLPPC